MPEGPARVIVGQDPHRNSHIAPSSHMRRGDPCVSIWGSLRSSEVRPLIKRTETPPLPFHLE